MYMVAGRKTFRKPKGARKMTTIIYNQNGRSRKAFVEAITSIIGAPMEYEGAPTFAYRVTESYIIDKNGNLVIEDIALDEEAAYLLRKLQEHGYTAENTEEAEKVMAESIEAHEAAQAQATAEAENGAAEATEAQDEPSTGATAEPPAGEPQEAAQAQPEGPAENDAAEATGAQDEPSTGATAATSTTTEDADDLDGQRFVISYPREMFDNHTLDNLDAIIESKGKLMRHAFLTESIDYKVSDDRVTFPWFHLGPDDKDGEAFAYTLFLDRLIKLAKDTTRITSKPRLVPNEKYAFRCFLLRLGFIGDEYKGARKILLRALSGSSAFKSGHKKEGAENA